jgi:hypothetical protein
MLDQARRNVPDATFHQRDLVDAVATADRFDAVVVFFSLLMRRHHANADRGAADDFVRAPNAPIEVTALDE